MTVIIDYDAGNLKSVQNAFRYIGEDTIITRSKELIFSADRVVLPGVGAFKDAMDKLNTYQLTEVIHDVIKKGTPFLGICLGLQLLFDSSEENEGVKGLGVLPGRILKIPDDKQLKIPHMGWNQLEIKKEKRLFEGVPNQAFVYFVHSYYLQAENKEIVAAATDYGTMIHAAVEYKNLFACQFHPEKSYNTGLRIIKNFVNINQ